MKYKTANEAFYAVVQDLFDAPLIKGSGPKPLQDSMKEHLNFQFSWMSPVDRLTDKLTLDVAVARFVWMMAANNRLADIAFYEPRVSAFTDDELTVPGSDYGMRLRQPQPGVDQVKETIKSLKKNPNTRRAAMSIYQPIDTTRRKSNDVSCAFGLLFHNRSDRLHTTVLMRSNNALTLLPFNLFEFSMLAEVMAVETGLELGEITYFAGSMHLYERDIDRAKETLNSKLFTPQAMPEMPRDESPLDQLKKLGKLDADLRHASATIDHRSIEEWIDTIKEKVTPYWAQFGLLLLSNIAKQRDQRTLDVVKMYLHEEYQSLAPEKAISPDNGVPVPFEISSEPLKEEGFTVHRQNLTNKIAEHAKKHEQEVGSVDYYTLLKVANYFDSRIAARGDEEVVSWETFQSVYQNIKLTGYNG